MLQKKLSRPEDDPFLFQLYASTRVEELQSWAWDQTTQQTFLTLQWTAQQQSYAAQYPDAEQNIILFRNCLAGRMIVSRTEHT